MNPRPLRMPAEHGAGMLGVRSWLSGGLLLVLAGIAFSPWLIQGKVLAPFDLLEGLISPWNGQKFASVPKVHNHFVSDAVTQYIPYGLFAKASYGADGYVGWNPLVFGGVAQHANTMSIPYDWSQRLYRWLDFWTVWHGGRLAQFLIAGLGMFFFLRGRGCDHGVSLMGATAYMLNSQFMVWIYHQWALASFCWIPPLFWALHQVHEGKRGFLVPSVLFLGLSLCGGSLQHAAFVFLALLCLWVGWLQGERTQSPAQITRDFLLAGLLASALVAPMLEATVTAYFETLRSGQVRGGLGYPAGWPQPILNFLALPFYAFPSLMGSPRSLDLWKMFRSDMFNVAFFGTVPILLAWIGLFSRNVSRPARLLTGVGLLLPLTPLVGPLYHRVQLLWVFGGCWCAAEWWQKSSPEDRRWLINRLWMGFFCLVGIWVLASFVLVFFQSRWEAVLQRHLQSLSATSQFGAFFLWMRQRLTNAFGDLLIWNPLQICMLTGLAVSILGLRTLASCKTPSWTLSALGVAGQALVFWWQWTTWSDRREEIYQQPHVVSILQREVGMDGRLAQAPGSCARIPLGPNTLQPSGVAITGGYDSIHPLGMVHGKNPWDFPGVTHYMAESKAMRPSKWPEVWTDGVWGLWKNPQPTFGSVTLAHGASRSLPSGSVLVTSLNTIKLTAPAGASDIELFSNSHRGWKWKFPEEYDWHDTQRGASGGIFWRLGTPLLQPSAICLQYRPQTPGWATGLQVAAILFLAGMSAYELKRTRKGVSRRARTGKYNGVR